MGIFWPIWGICYGVLGSFCSEFTARVDGNHEGNEFVWHFLWKVTKFLELFTDIFGNFVAIQGICVSNIQKRYSKHWHNHDAEKVRV